MTDPPRPDFLELADYTGVLCRRGWIALALAGLGALVSVVYLAVAPASYQATADVYVSAVPRASARYQLLRNVPVMSP